MLRTASVSRRTQETNIQVTLALDGAGRADVATQIPFFDHMLTLFAVHGFFDIQIAAHGDLAVDFHHTVEDVGLVLGDALSQALGDRKGIRRFGHRVTPMDEALAAVSIDLSKRPYLVYNFPLALGSGSRFDGALAKEFFRAFSQRGGMNLHVNVQYGENEHHVLEAIFKSVGRALAQAVSLHDRAAGVRSSKGSL